MTDLAWYPLALAATLACEVPIALGLGQRRRHVAATALFANLLTHPLATLLLLQWGHRLAFGLVEFAVIAVEALAYQRVAGLGVGRALTISVATNVTTAVLSLALWS